MYLRFSETKWFVHTSQQLVFAPREQCGCTWEVLDDVKNTPFLPVPQSLVNLVHAISILQILSKPPASKYISSSLAPSIG